MTGRRSAWPPESRTRRPLARLDAHPPGLAASRRHLHLEQRRPQPLHRGDVQRRGARAGVDLGLEAHAELRQLDALAPADLDGRRLMGAGQLGQRARQLADAHHRPHRHPARAHEQRHAAGRRRQHPPPPQPGLAEPGRRLARHQKPARRHRRLDHAAARRVDGDDRLQHHAHRRLVRRDRRSSPAVPKATAAPPGCAAPPDARGARPRRRSTTATDRAAPAAASPPAGRRTAPPAPAPACAPPLSARSSTTCGVAS